MSARRKVPDAETARAWLHAAERSGLTRVQWCAREKVDARSLHCWRLALGRRVARGVAPFVEWVPRPELSTAMVAVPPPLRVHVAGVVVEVGPGFHAASLAEVLRVLRSC